MHFKRGVLQIIIIVLIFIINEVASRPENSLDILSKIINKGPSNPLIIILDAHNKLLRSSDNPHDLNVAKSASDRMDNARATYWMNEILRSTGDENNPIVQKTNEKFEEALRTRCEAFFQCQITCKVKITKIKKDSCEKSCKEVYDYLMTCNPPGGKKEKDSCEDTVESDECEETPACKPECSSRGKTMPPDWRF